MGVQIEKGVPMPRLGIYPWAEMEVGDSFFVAEATHAQLSGAVQSAKKKTGFKFITRAAEGGIRIWRVE